MAVLNYPIAFGFGAKDGTYYGPNGRVGPFHHGNDYGTPIGTEVNINGTVLGWTGNTGLVDGPHVHIDKNPGYPGAFGNYVNPQDWSNITGSVVFAGNAGTAGNMVVVRADNGYYYRFLHLSRINVGAGARIGNTQPTPANQEGGNPIMNEGDVINMYIRLLGRDPRNGDIGGLRNYTGKDWKSAIYDFTGSKEFNDRIGQISSLSGAVAERDRIISELRTALENEQKKPPKEVIKEVEKIVEKPVEVVKEVAVYTHDETTKQNVSAILKIVNSIRGLVLNLFRKRKDK